MNDLISRQAVLSLPKDIVRNMSGEIIEEFVNLEDVKALPSAQPERETAKFIRWMECKKTADYISYTPHCKCSKCGNELLIEAINYCYICGARMEGSDERSNQQESGD